MSYPSQIWTLTPDGFASAAVQQRIGLLDERSRQLTLGHLPLTANGWCDACQGLRSIDFRANHGMVDDDRGMFHIAYSETGVCTTCLVNSRQRFAAEMLRTRPTSARVYMTEHQTALRMRLALTIPDLVSSEYLGDHAPGAMVDGVRHEDLHHLSFASGSKDVILSLDVLEHVHDPLRALREIERVLAPGGLAVVTFPLFADRETTVRRSDIADGAIVNLLDPEYHGNPLGGGSLVFSEFGWDFLREALASIPGSRFVHYFSALALHLGGWRFALLIEKA
jgi:hypothetical protein